ncbi:hypothetical protein K2173_020328 [Erythroxylum novogranatense]|uniref:Exocyst subunit Exo70 family protein n=1 Tax=Erythroxylum novogranatense TaxID=1862640 RepID=A0AAV8UAY2_9ROSI|nr:hypothetical protein K2173_020328 [Erythroxylum novogranatense]
MGDFEPVTPELGGEENLVAAANQILRAIGPKKNLTGDEKKILADLATQLSSMNLICQDEVYELSDFERRLNDTEEKVLNWEADQSMIWDRGPYEACKYLDTADEVRKLTENLEILSLRRSEDGAKDMLRRAHNVLQMVMARLEEEFKSILVQNGQPYEPAGFLCFRSGEDEFADVSSVVSGEDEFADVSSVVSGEDESMKGSLHRDSVNRTSEEFIIDPVHQDVIPDLRRIANLMFKSKYDHECLQAYISVRRDALDECLLVLEMEKMSIEDVLKLEWSQMNTKMKRWARAMKIFVRIYLASEKWLSEQVFVEVGAVHLMCFTEASKSSLFQLLNFGEAIFIGPHKTEKMYPILEMYEVLEDLLPDIDSLYSDEAGCSVRMDCRDLLRRLGDAGRAAFLEFENAIASSPSTPLASGGIHPLTKYVMNYIRTLTDYRETLNLLLKDHSRNDVIGASPDRSSGMEEDNTSEYASTITPMAFHFRSIVTILECNLEEKATMYRSPSLHHIFLMNNIHYIAQKVKNSKLRLIFGDDWIRKRNRKVQLHALNYERVTWSSVLALLKDVEIPSSHLAARSLLKERFRSFYLAFEEVYKNQKGWSIPDNQLRKELKISTSIKVVLAYRTFVGRHSNHVSYNHIKYTVDDLEKSLEEMFERMQEQLHHPNRKTTLGLQSTHRETITSNQLNNSIGQDHRLTKVGLELLGCLVDYCGTTYELTL